jgi:hypothetical protein
MLGCTEQQNITDMSECRQLQGNVEKGDGSFAKRMLVGKYEVTWAVIEHAENTGHTLYRRYATQMIRWYMIRAIHDSVGNRRYIIQAIHDTGDI